MIPAAYRALARRTEDVRPRMSAQACQHAPTRDLVPTPLYAPTASPEPVSAKIPTRDGFRLAAEVWPSVGADPHRAVVFVHGFCGNRSENGLFRKLAEECSAKGLTAVLYDWRGLAPSEGDFASTSLDDHVADFQQVVQWTQQQFALDSGALSAVGFSLGAAVIGCALREKTTVGSLAYLSPAVRPRLDMWPRYNTPSIKRELAENGVVEKPGTSVLLGETILTSLRETDLGSHALDLEVPLLVCHGTADTRINCEGTRKLVDARKRRAPKSSDFDYWEFSGASHSFRPSDSWWDHIASAVTTWFSARPSRGS
ncbi:MAG TPA: alpha/beta fold hydrolase [Thermoleophilaceae bacterium]|nr:alpha/beta fold hydrolase [Thermoleophilaceae bacterium]